MKQIIAHIKLDGGSLLSAKNSHRIIARSTRPSDKSGNRLPTPIERYRNDPPYFQKWVIRKEKDGYIFREVNHGGGICGAHKTVRRLVEATLCGLSSDILVEVMP
jgi:hypothetical protein